MLQLVEMEVGSSERHHQVSQSNQRRVNIGKQTNLSSVLTVEIRQKLKENKENPYHNMTIEHCHCSLFLVLLKKM